MTVNKANRKNVGVDKKTGDGPPPESAFNMLINETTLLFHRLKIVADQVHHQGEMSGGLRSILRSLDVNGSQTVPQMARSRSVSRQNIQAIINQLIEDGCVELVHNPAHKRSALARLTARGKKLVDLMNRREHLLLGKADLSVSEKKMREASETLRNVRALFEGEQWKRILKTTK